MSSKKIRKSLLFVFGKQQKYIAVEERSSRTLLTNVCFRCSATTQHRSCARIVCGDVVAAAVVYWFASVCFKREARTRGKGKATVCFDHVHFLCIALHASPLYFHESVLWQTSNMTEWFILYRIIFQ